MFKILSFKKRYIYINVLLIYLTFNILKNNWSNKFDKKPICKKQSNVNESEFVDLENHETDITKSLDNKDNEVFYKVNYDKHLELVVKFIFICFIVIIGLISNIIL